MASRKVQAKIARLLQGKGAFNAYRKSSHAGRAALNQSAKNYLQTTKSRVPKTKSLARRLLDKSRKIIGLPDKDNEIKEKRSFSAKQIKLARSSTKSAERFNKQETRQDRHSRKRHEIFSKRIARDVRSEPSQAYKRKMEKAFPKPVERKTAIKAKPTQKAKRMGMK